MANKALPEAAHKKLFKVMAETLDDPEQEYFPAALQAVKEYLASHDELRRSSVKLSDYVTSALVDRGAPMPEPLRDALDEAQTYLGEIHDPNRPLVAI